MKDLISSFKLRTRNKIRCRYPETTTNKNGDFEFVEEQHNILLEEKQIILCNMKKNPAKITEAVKQDFKIKKILEEVYNYKVNCVLYFSNGDENIINEKLQELLKIIPNLSYLFWLPFSEAAKFTSELSNELSELKESIVKIKEKIEEKIDEKFGQLMKLIVDQKQTDQNLGFLSNRTQKGETAFIELY